MSLHNEADISVMHVFLQYGREFRLHGMVANASYAVEAKADCLLAATVGGGGEKTAGLDTFLPAVAAEGDGVLKFRAHAHCGVAVQYLGSR